MLGRIVGIAALFAASYAQAVTYQAEDAVLSGVTVGTSVAGYTGTGYVEGFDTDTDEITFTLNSSTQALYDLTIRYSAPYGDKQTTVVLNSASGSNIQFVSNDSWTTVSGGQLLLNAGSNTLEIKSNWGWYLIDSITIEPSAPRAPHQITSTPINPSANSDAKALLKYLAAQYGNKILSGQQDSASVDWITQNIGKTPAIIGLDLMDYTESRISRGASSTDVEKAIAFAQKGGIVAFVWHWGAPAGLYDTAEEPWYSGFYTAATSFDVSQAMANTTNDLYQLLVKDIDTIAVQLKRLQDAGIPVLWRPLHEAEGGWFWWGAKGAEPCKKLYALLYDRLTNYHKLNNLIWIWNSVATSWYPGDATVDIVSADTYLQGDHGAISATYNSLLDLGQDKKMIAAAEVGSIPDPDILIAYQADWLYFCTWSGDYISGGTWNTVDFIKKVYTHDYVLTLDEIQGWKNGTTPPVTTSTTSRSSTTLTTSTRASSTTTKTSPPATTTTSSGTVPKWGQCGGIGYTGPTQCVSGSNCVKQNDWYYQCI